MYVENLTRESYRKERLYNPNCSCDCAKGPKNNILSHAITPRLFCHASGANAWPGSFGGSLTGGTIFLPCTWQDIRMHPLVSLVHAVSSKRTRTFFPVAKHIFIPPTPTPAKPYSIWPSISWDRLISPHTITHLSGNAKSQWIHSPAGWCRPLRTWVLLPTTSWVSTLIFLGIL